MVSALDLLHLCRAAAERAAAYLRGVERPADPARWTVKGSRDFVTEVDRRAEGIVAEVLLAAEPGSRMVGEELSPDLIAATLGETVARVAGRLGGPCLVALDSTGLRLSHASRYFERRAERGRQRLRARRDAVHLHRRRRRPQPAGPA